MSVKHYNALSNKLEKAKYIASGNVTVGEITQWHNDIFVKSYLPKLRGIYVKAKNKDGILIGWATKEEARLAGIECRKRWKERIDSGYYDSAEK